MHDKMSLIDIFLSLFIKIILTQNDGFHDSTKEKKERTHKELYKFLCYISDE